MIGRQKLHRWDLPEPFALRIRQIADRRQFGAHWIIFQHKPTAQRARHLPAHQAAPDYPNSHRIAHNVQERN